MTESKPPTTEALFYQSDAEFKPPSTPVSLLDTLALGRETIEFQRKYKDENAFDRLRNIGTSRMWDKPFLSALVGLDRATSDYDKFSSIEAQTSYTFRGHSIHTVYFLGATLHFADSFKKAAQHASRAGKDIKTSVDVEFLNRYASIDNRVSGVSLRQVYEQTKKDRLPLASLLTFFMSTQTSKKGDVPDTFFEENTSPITREFPNRAIDSFQTTKALLVDVLNVSSDQDQTEFRKAERKYPASAAPYTKRILERTREFRDRLFNTITDPESEEFENTKQKVAEYTAETSMISHVLFYLITRNDNGSMQKLYRKSLKHKDNPVHGEFYRQFTEVLRNYTDFTSEFTNLRTQEDLEEVFSPTEEIKTDIPPLGDYRKMIARIIPNKPRDEYDIVTSDIDWGELTPPQSATFNFIPGKPMRCYMTLQYETDNEAMNVMVLIDAKTAEYDWNFLEDPESPEMKPFASAAQRVMSQVLGQVETVAKREKEERATKPVTIVTREILKKDSVRPMKEEELVSKKRKHRRGDDVNLMAVAEEAAAQKEAGIKKTITVPEKKEMAKKMKTLSEEDRQLAREAIAEYNERGIGGWTILRAKTKEGESMFRLRARGVRVLLTEGEPQDKSRTFEIISIAKRGSVYEGL